MMKGKRQPSELTKLTDPSRGRKSQEKTRGWERQRLTVADEEPCSDTSRDVNLLNEQHLAPQVSRRDFAEVNSERAEEETFASTRDAAPDDELGEALRAGGNGGSDGENGGAEGDGALSAELVGDVSCESGR